MVAESETDDEKTEIEDGEEERESPMVKLDFAKLFKMAEDPDLEELLRSPLDQALQNLDRGVSCNNNPS
ncbi:unnamed protein product [Caenorhabditis angaria]|uniref:Uncharacterized protein n=1 Tax=Caenorhabditis angaria TaxID=860376 RepID=A0A9P1ID91_9PELO|nr:unnamed protein product [Caenorhabditis angaria]